MDDTFTPLVTVVTAEDDDDRIWPTLSGPDQSFPVELGEEDGERIHWFTASGLNLRRLPAAGKEHEEVILEENHIVGAVTDSRVVFACEKWDKGGGWMGFGLAGMTVAAGANLVSRARAARRRQGQVLVGQVRYPWLAYAGGRTGSWWSKDQLGLAAWVSNDQGGGGQIVVLQAPKGEGDCHDLAADVARRAATWRLQHDRFAPDSARATFQQLTTARPKRGRRGAKSYAAHDLPNAYSVDAFSAFAMNKQLDEAWQAWHQADAGDPEGPA